MACSSEETNLSVIINYISGKYFVWNADDVFTLRTKHRVCGQLVGSIPRKPWQPCVHSLPLILVPAEAHFCYKNGIAKIVDGKDYFAKREINSSDINDFQNKRQNIGSDQIKIFKTKKEESEKLYFGFSKKLLRRAKRNFGEIDIETCNPDSKDDARKTELETSNAKSAKVECENCNLKSDLHNSEPDSVPFDSECEAVDKTSECKQSSHLEASCPQFSEENSTPSVDSGTDNETKIEIHWENTLLSDEDFKYYDNSVRIHIPTNVTTENLFDSFLSNYPMTEKEKCSCAVYEDLLKRGLFVTSALKFGGDFLVYLGDPLRHHSHYIVIVLNRNEIISTKELVTYGRLAASVKKTVVLATLNCDFSTVDYLSLTWAQMK